MLFLFAMLVGCADPPAARMDTPASSASPAASPAASVQVDRRLSVGRAPFGDIDLWLELGDRTVGDVDRMLADAAARYADPNARLAALTDAARGTPFEYESQLPLLSPGTLRVQLRSFDCTTFVITMVAMTGSRSFEELALNLRRLRYLDGMQRVDADPTDGNVLDYGYELGTTRARRCA